MRLQGSFSPNSRIAWTRRPSRLAPGEAAPLREVCASFPLGGGLAGMPRRGSAAALRRVWASQEGDFCRGLLSGKRGAGAALGAEVTGPILLRRSGFQTYSLTVQILPALPWQLLRGCGCEKSTLFVGLIFFFLSVLWFIVQHGRILLPQSTWQGLLPGWVFPTWRCGWVQPDGLGELQKLSLDVELFPDFF